MMLVKFECSRPGELIEGHVLDCRKKWLEQKLKDFDKDLYLKWNGKSAKGRGKWELRLRNTKYKICQGALNGLPLYTLDYLESHSFLMFDMNYLGLPVYDRIRSWTDVRDLKSPISKIYEEKEFEIKDRANKKAMEDFKYNVKQTENVWDYFMQKIARGENPGPMISGKF